MPREPSSEPVIHALWSLLCWSLILASPVQGRGEGLRGFWVAPDWLLPPGESAPEEPAVRARVAHVLDRIAEMDGNTIFLEVFLRGYHVGPSVGPQVPLYPRLLDEEGAPRFDLVGIVLEEARSRSLDVHGWFHVFYYRTDNRQLLREGQGGPSVFDPLFRTVLEGMNRDPVLATLLEDGLDRGRLVDTARLALVERGIDVSEGVLGALMRVARENGSPHTDFLLTEPDGSLHPSLTKDRWKAIYLDPAHEGVQRILVDQARSLLEAYPDLAGLHLDHVRYPASPRGLSPRAAGLAPGQDVHPRKQRERHRAWLEERSRRESAVGALVERMRDLLRPDQHLSAAVHPMYYHHRDDWEARLEGPDFIGQDWFAWDLDFVAPMAYASDAARIRRIARRMRFGLKERRPTGARTAIHPGTDRSSLIGPDSPLPSWVYFDFHQFKWVDEGFPDPPKKPTSEAGRAREPGSRKRRRSRSSRDSTPCFETLGG